MISISPAYLVVDDFEVMRKVTAQQLRTFGANVIFTATNGAEALRILRKESIDMVLSDLSMPVMSGLELLKAVRADEDLSHLPFIVITAEFDRRLIKEVIDAGVDDLLVKPYTTDQLARRIEKAQALRHSKALQLPMPGPPKTPTLTILPAPDRGSEPGLNVSSAGLVAGLPVPPVPESPVLSEPAPAQRTVRQSLLVVDDTPDNLHLLSQLFKEDYLVRLATNGLKALKICSSDEPPDLVLLDIMMPGLDGFEVARLMREHPGSANIPIIFITALTDYEARLKGMSLGAVDFVSKPIDPQMLQLRVGNFMRYVALHKQLQSDYDDMLELARLHEDVAQMTRHDMRGPLAGALSLLQIMGSDDGLDKKQADQLRLVEDTVLQVLNMINLSAEIFKIETGVFKLHAQPILIGDILRRIVQIARTTYSEKKLVLRSDTDTLVGKEPPQALGDALFCYSIFQNLLKNACEAAPPKSLVLITLADTDPLRILIKNSGVVPTEVRERFFEKFVTRKKTGGSGLGTYSAKLLVEAQGGHIVMETSDDDNTTSLWVTLPRHA